MNVTHKIDPNQREDLRKVYLAIHGSAIVTDIPEVAADLGLKRQYVKELFGILATHSDRDGNAFIVINYKAGEGSNDTPHDWWQTSHTIDDHNEDDAQHWFDEHFPVQLTTQPKVAAPRTPLNATNPADLPLCLCGCNQPVTNRNRNYKPGHDARHAGQVARYIAAQDEEGDSNTREAALAMLPTESLRSKADAMATRLLKKAASKAINQTPEKLAKEMAKDIVELVGEEKRTHTSGPAIRPVTFEVGEIKLGRWVYKAERNTTSGAVTFERKGQQVVADDKQAAKFTPTGATFTPHEG